MLVRLLVAEDLIIQDNSCNMLEDIAARVIDELISLGMLNQHPIDAEYIEVPSLYRQLCDDGVDMKKFVAKDPHSPIRLYILDDGRDNLSLNLSSFPIKSLSVQAALYQNFIHCPEGRLSRVYSGIICRLKTLIVLSLDGHLECLPDEIEDLIHLKHLCSSEPHLQELPRTIRKLQNLQTSIMIHCSLPVEVFDIQQLRHLIMSTCVDNFEIRVPRKIGTMKILQTLCGVYAGGGIAEELNELTHQLRRLKALRVSEDHAIELFAATLKMTNLVSLSMAAEKTYIQEEEERFHELALFPETETFSPPCPLQEVHLRGQLIEMPSWFVPMENLTNLRLSSSCLPDHPTPKIQGLFSCENFPLFLKKLENRN